MRDRHGPSENLTIQASLMAKRVETKNPCRMRRPNHHQKIGRKG
jgi:hypothetical protein